MKISDIISEAISPEHRANIQYLLSRGQRELATAIQIELGYTDKWDAAAEAAKAKLAAKSAAQTASQQTTTQPDRTRKDSAGRNLKHDRYYNEKPPISRARDAVVKPAAAATNAVQRKFRRGGEIANKFMQ